VAPRRLAQVEVRPAALAEEPEDQAIVQSIIDLSRVLGLAVVAEGVEDRQTAHMCSRRLGAKSPQDVYSLRRCLGRAWRLGW
jgi:predicted signal transduction protein with EAL and GGDEF domain